MVGMYAVLSWRLALRRRRQLASEHVFERFFRGHASPSGKGAGLGLSVVRSVAEAHGGEALIESTPGSGTRVEMVLPRRLPAPAAPLGAAAEVAHF